MIRNTVYIVCFLLTATLSAQQLAVLKYKGGGDWYANPTALKNLIVFSNKENKTTLTSKPAVVEVGSSALFDYPFVHMTGHGNVIFSEEEGQNLKTYLYSGGFLHIDDNYGMEPYLKKAIAKVFPDKKWISLGYDHPIFHQKFDFNEGLPKIHEHDGKQPQALGLFHENRLILLFTIESDLGDGWEDAAVHNDSKEVREKALQMGANILNYAFTN